MGFFAYLFKLSKSTWIRHLAKWLSPAALQNSINFERGKDNLLPENEALFVRVLSADGVC
jgi:hypothetical protein